MTEKNLLLVSGSDDFRRERVVRQITRKRVSSGWKSEVLNGDDPSLEVSLGAVGILFAEKRVIVIRHPEKAPLSLLQAQITEPNRDVLLVLDHEGEIKASSLFYKNFVSKLPKGVAKNFTEVPSYKARDDAYQFVMEEVSALGNTLEEALAYVLVDRVGTDLGVLSFELLKASLFAGEKNPITSNVLRATMAPLMDLGGQPLLDAISDCNRPKTMLELRRIELSGGSDQTIRICGAFLSPSFLRWMAAIHLHQSGVSPANAAGRASANPWYWEHKILAPALRWGYRGCRVLVEAVAEAQTAVFQGVLSPWNILEVRLLRAFGSRKP